MAGYSGTPLAKKLGIKGGHTVAALHEPDGFREWLEPVPEGARIRKSIGRAPDVVIVFATKRAVLERNLLKAAAPNPLSPPRRPRRATGPPVIGRRWGRGRRSWPRVVSRR